MVKKYCGVKEILTGFVCLKRSGHTGEHMSCDNRCYDENGNPGRPIRWSGDDFPREITEEHLDPMVTNHEIHEMQRMNAARRNAVSMINGGTPTGGFCAMCGTEMVREPGKTCDSCPTCHETGGCS